MDLIYVLLMLACSGLTVALIRGLEHLRRRP
jgi:hypothetical protein